MDAVGFRKNVVEPKLKPVIVGLVLDKPIWSKVIESVFILPET